MLDIEKAKEILLLLYILGSLFSSLAGMAIGEVLGRRNILKKLKFSGKLDAETLALLEEY